MVEETGKKKDETNVTREEVNKILTQIDAVHETTIKVLDKKINSRWTSGKDKSNFRMYKAIIKMVDDLYKESIRQAYINLTMDKHLDKIDELLHTIVKQLDIEFPTLKADIQKLNSAVKDPMIAHVYDYIQERKKILEKSSKAGDEYVE